MKLLEIAELGCHTAEYCPKKTTRKTQGSAIKAIYMYMFLKFSKINILIFLISWKFLNVPQEGLHLPLEKPGNLNDSG